MNTLKNTAQLLKNSYSLSLLLLGIFFSFQLAFSISANAQIQQQQRPQALIDSGHYPSFYQTRLLIPDSAQQQLPLLAPAPYLHKGRTIGISTFISVSYIASMIAMNEIWYGQYERTPFHFFNDNKGWLQIDKVGHAWTAYAEAEYATELYRWMGSSDRKSAYWGAATAFILQGGIELLDGFSAEWGASTGDIISNTSGALLYLGQELAWKEQRIRIKFLPHFVSYKDYDQEVQERAIALYGNNFGERILKDYNGQTYWASVNLKSFMKEERRFPDWLNIAIGYGAEDMFGGDDNIWEDENGLTIDKSNINRYRQYYLSLDVDLSRIKAKRRWARFLLGGFNVLKIPAPAIQFNSQGKVKFHPVFF